jgi:oligo-alginate lyase
MNATLIKQAAEKVETHAWARDLRDAIGARVRSADLRVPDQAGGWIHDYVCLDHWEALEHRENAHWCPQGHPVSGEKIDAAWRMYEHRRLADTAADAGVLFALTNDATYAQIAHEILRQYAERYAHYVHAAQDWMLKGHVMQQALTEALWGVPVGQAARLIREFVTPQEWAFLRDGLLLPLAQTLHDAQNILIHERQKPHSNYNAWLIAALTTLADSLDDHALLETCADQVRQHLDLALLPDGMQWEGSPYYHMFVALALTIAAETLYGRGVDLYRYTNPRGQSLRSLWDVLVQIAGAGGELPHRRDGPYWRGGPFMRELAQLFEIAQARTDAPEYRWLLTQAYHHTPRDSRYALLYGCDGSSVPPDPTSLNLADTGLAILRDGQQTITLEYGEHGGEHGHLDKLSLHIWNFNDDPGTPPYAISERRSYYQHTAAHNTVLVDVQPQQECSGELLEWAADRVSAAANQAYAGVRFRRTVQIAAGEIHDETLLDSADSHTYDWLLHGRGNVTLDSTAIPQHIDERLAKDAAGQLVTLYTKARFAEEIRVRFSFEQGVMTVQIMVDHPAVLLLGDAPGLSHHPQIRRPVVVVRLTAKQARIQARYWLERGPLWSSL